MQEELKQLRSEERWDGIYLVSIFAVLLWSRWATLLFIRYIGYG